MVNLGNARIKRRWIVLKALGAALSLGAGASVGREGPIAQIGGAIGSAVAQLRRLSVDRAKVLVAAGAGAGIATTFNAPMGGLMFAQEIVLMGQTELTNLVLVIIATFTAVVISRAIMGNAGGLSSGGLRDAQLLGAVQLRPDGRGAGPARRGLYPVLPRHRALLPRTEITAMGQARDRSRRGRRDRDRAAAKSLRRLSGNRSRDGRRASESGCCWR